VIQSFSQLKLKLHQTIKEVKMITKIDVIDKLIYMVKAVVVEFYEVDVKKCS